MSNRGIRLGLIVVLVLVLLSACAGPDSSEVPETTGVERLQVKSGELVNGQGESVQLTGMSSHGILWYSEYTNANALRTLKEYGANTFRIAVYSDDENGGYVQQKEETLRRTYMAIENTISMDLYAIVDWHVLRDCNPLTNQAHALEFFEQISAHYGDCPNLIYEICNEPNTNTSWDDIYAYANAVIPVIRNHAPNAVIIVGTPGYSYSVESVFERPLEFENVMYSFHFYAGQHDTYYNELFNRCDRNDIPVFVSEWGINYDLKGEPALSQAETFVTVLNRRNISWVGWSLCNKEEVFSAIKPDCTKLSGWELDDLTAVGKVFFEAFD